MKTFLQNFRGWVFTVLCVLAVGVSTPTALAAPFGNGTFTTTGSDPSGLMSAGTWTWREFYGDFVSDAAYGGIKFQDGGYLMTYAGSPFGTVSFVFSSATAGVATFTRYSGLTWDMPFTGNGFVPPGLTFVITNNDVNEHGYEIKKNGTTVYTGNVIKEAVSTLGPYTNFTNGDIIQYYDIAGQSILQIYDGVMGHTGKTVQLTLTAPPEPLYDFTIKVANRNAVPAPYSIHVSGVIYDSGVVQPGTTILGPFNGPWAGKLIQFFDTHATVAVELKRFAFPEINSGNISTSVIIPVFVLKELDSDFFDDFPPIDRIIDNDDLPTPTTNGRPPISPPVDPTPKPTNPWDGPKGTISNPFTGDMGMGDFYDVIFKGIRDALKTNDDTKDPLGEVEQLDKSGLDTAKNAAQQSFDDFLTKTEEFGKEAKKVFKDFAPSFITYDRVSLITITIPWKDDPVTYDLDNLPLRNVIIVIGKLLICLMALATSFKLVSWALT